MPDFSDFLLTADYDRTLTAPDSTIPVRNLEAIRYFMENGGTFTVNTGRSLALYRSLLDTVPVNAPLLLFNGSAAYDPATQRFLFCHPIDLDPAECVKFCLDTFPDLFPEIQGIDAHYGFRPDSIWERCTRQCHCRAQLVHPQDNLGSFIKLTLYGRFREPTISHLFQATDTERRRMDVAEQVLREQFGSHMEIFRSGARIIDCHAKGVSKSHAARQLQQALHKTFLVCIGDAENDLTMLQGADYAYCPADGALASRFETVCPCTEGSVADVIFEKIPKILSNSP